ncbi:hypothetical protein DVH24_021193 [Malus domestica]|uniref:Uncharacterized protein n=1 Tax=Malus domestica TaxID=3750 RepID=A0A498KQF7_MALDO|nr:hypothetical protein DVH24_021193 [Malus domestica]
MVELNFLHSIRAGYPTCEAKCPHALHVTLLCCPRVRLENCHTYEAYKISLLYKTDNTRNHDRQLKEKGWRR